MDTIDQCMKYAETKDEFISLMESEGYQVRWTDSRKNITYTTPNGMKCRDDRLHEIKYTKEVMGREFQIRALSRQVGQLPTQSQLEALARDVAQMRAELKQAGKKKELSVSPPSLETALSVLIWLALILLGTLVGMVVLRTIWSGLAALWSAVRTLIP